MNVNLHMKSFRVRWAKSVFYLFTFLPFCLSVSCTQDNYEKGEGEYSQMTADFVEAGVGNDKRINYVVTDEGDSLIAYPRFTAKSIETADTVYRAILYYNRVKNDKGQDAADAIGLSLVPTLIPYTIDDLKQVMTDPVRLESIWLARNKRYVNVSIILKTGQPDTEDARQTIALLTDSVQTHHDGRRTLCCTLYHDQGGVPEYYSLQRYFSIPVSRIPADTLRLTINTYEGQVVKVLSLL